MTQTVPEAVPEALEGLEGLEGRATIRLTLDLQPNFALNQPLSPFALAVFELLQPAPGSPDQPTTPTGHYALDMISVIEATLDDPRPVTSQQQFLARGEAVAAMKAEGIEYDQRMDLLEEITHPQPPQGVSGCCVRYLQRVAGLGNRLRTASEVGRARPSTSVP